MRRRSCFSAADTGFISENVYLYCASEGLATVVRANVAIVLLILILGLFLLILSRRKKTGKVFILIGVLLLGTLSYEAVSERLLKPLEYMYPPLIHPVNMEDVRWIVVLGGGHTSDQRLSVTSQISDLSLSRLVEGIRLHREIPNSKLILSGGRVFIQCPKQILWPK